MTTPIPRPADGDKALDALQAVLDLHAPYFLSWCGACDDPTHQGGSWECADGCDYWPCETVNTVCDGLGVRRLRPPLRHPDAGEAVADAYGLRKEDA